MKQIETIWETYRSCWDEKNADTRLNRLGEIMMDDFQYKDPNIELIGYNKLSNYMEEFQEQFVGASFEVTNINVHHDSIMANWSMLDSNKEVVANGVDFAKFANGRLQQITGFFKEA